MRLNKISGLRYREETERGYDIVNNSKLDGAATTIKQDQVDGSGPVKVWNNMLLNANPDEKVQAQIETLNQEEYYAKLKKRGVNAEFRQQELSKLTGNAKENPLQRTVYNTRSKRITLPEPPVSKRSMQASQRSAPKSMSQARSQASKAVSSKREIRTGGFSNLGS